MGHRHGFVLIGTGGKRKEKNKTMGRLTMQFMIPVIFLFLGLLAVMFQAMAEARQLVYRYIEDTARLYVEQINGDITKINDEVITLASKNKGAYAIPPGIGPRDSQYYPVLNKIQEQNRNLKIRYKEPCCFYTYLEHADLLVTDSGCVFKNSKRVGLNQALLQALEEKKGEGGPNSKWYFIHGGSQAYVTSRFSKNGVTMGCVIKLDDLLDILRINSLGYQGIPYIQDRDGTIFVSEKDGNKLNPKHPAFFSKGEVYTFPINGIIGDGQGFHIMIRPSGGILERIMRLQAILVLFATGAMIGCGLVVRVYCQRILRPMKQFVNSLKNADEEVWINQNGSNNILELEMASKEFKGLLRKIKALKIDIYEKELARQKTELEAMQVQIKPHFYLNCLNLIHGMADVSKEGEIVAITEMLTHYMRYVMSDAFEPKPLEEEIKFIQNYVEIQQLRYGKEAFSFELMMEEGASCYLVPRLVIHNFVENAITHGVSFDEQVEISLYVVTENYEDGEYLYICISDTGKGFPPHILDCLKQEKPIYYDGRKHIGIGNSLKRMKIMYGEKAKADFSNMGEGKGAVVELTIPAQKM